MDSELKLPRHIAFIMSGNRRWARARYMPDTVGHNKGVENMRKIASLCFKKGIKTASFWAMSTENLVKRPEKEISNLFRLVESYSKKAQEFVKNNIRVLVIGNLKALPENVQRACDYVMKETDHCTGGQMGVLLNYGGKWEIVEAVSRVVAKGEAVNEDSIQSNLPTSALGDPDLIVRCGKDMRTSGFYSWTNAYSELYFTDIPWPDFKERQLNSSLEFFANSSRNFGK